MKTVDQKMDDFVLQYPLENICVPESTLFIDIETTGFSAASSSLYMIGCAYVKDGIYHTIQWFAENPEEQSAIIHAFAAFSEDFSFLVHFNGNRFDIPYLTQKCEEFGISFSFDRFDGLDLYRRITPCQKLLSLENCRQKTLERFLSTDREDPYTGGELIAVYQEYVAHPSNEGAELLLLHNREDLTGMLSILPILSYCDCLTHPLKAKKVQANHYRDVNDEHRMELLITVLLPSPVPKPLSHSAQGFHAVFEGSECVIRVPVYEETLKYFYSNYKDYYFLPKEDLALHKSIATFVDREHRIQASAHNCYTRKKSIFLRQWDYLFAPFFQREYRDPDLFFELTDEMKKNREAFAAYASHVLKMLAAH